MEVHAHAHTARKKWTHYLWEFIMLFLAVFCGFLAEYQLEHKIESDRGKQYIRSFYEDLVNDSAHFNYLIHDFEEKISLLNSLPACYDSLLSGHPQGTTMTRICTSVMYFTDMIFTDRTLTQLKNAGGLRLLKKADADSILLYDNLLRNYKTAETTGMQEIQTAVRQTYTELRDFKAWADSSNTSSIVTLNLNDKFLLNKFFNQLNIYKNYCRARLINLNKIKSSNGRLIDYLEMKYHL